MSTGLDNLRPLKQLVNFGDYANYALLEGCT